MACNLPALVSSEQETLKLKVFVHTGLHCPADQNRYLYKDSVILDLQYITFDSICFVAFDSVGSFNFMHPQRKKPLFLKSSQQCHAIERFFTRPSLSGENSLSSMTQASPGACPLGYFPCTSPTLTGYERWIENWESVLCVLV